MMSSACSPGALPLVERLEDDEHRAEVGGVRLQQKRQSRDGDRVGHARLSWAIFRRAPWLPWCAERRRVGQLDIHDQPALVLLRDETRGCPSKTQYVNTTRHP